MTIYPQYLRDRRTLACLCGEPGGVTIRRKDRYGLPFSYKFCLHCGHVRTSNPLSSESETRFYSSSDYRTLYLPGEEPLQVLKRKTPTPNHKSALLRYVENWHPTPGTILEWGCGGGWNLVPFRDAGWKTAGYDYDATYIALGRDHLGLDLGTLETLNRNATANFNPDVILLNHVLEHASDPIGQLVQLSQFAGPDTLIVIGVPLLETLKHWHWRDFFHVAHVHYFSARSLRAAAESAGLRIVDERVSEGMFVLQIADLEKKTPGRNLQGVVTSSFFLFSGWIDPKFRLRALARICLKASGLLRVARSMRDRLRR